MVLKTFAVYDSKAKAFQLPIYCPQAGQAIREFTHKVNTPDHPWNLFPEDYSLHETGTWSDQNAQSENLTAAHQLVTALEVLKEDV